MPDLADLALVRNGMYAVELAAFLHNLGKLSPRFLITRDDSNSWVKGPNVRNQRLKDTVQRYPQIQIGPYTGAFKDITEGAAKKNLESPVDLVKLMAYCHAEASGSEKRPERREHTETSIGVKQGRDPARWAQLANTYPRFGFTSFGFPFAAYQNEAALWELQDRATAVALEALEALQAGRYPRRTFLDRLERALNPGLAESQIPIVDVRISDTGLMAAAFLKAILAQDHLKNEITPPKGAEWRLLRFAVDVSGFAEHSVRMADVYARRESLRASLTRLRAFVEEEVGIGNQVYEDEQGIAFLIGKDNSWDAQVSQRIADFWQNDAVGRDVQFLLEPSEPFGLGVNKGYAHQLGRMLCQSPPDPMPTRASLANHWKERPPAEVCPTCGIRPVVGRQQRGQAEDEGNKKIEDIAAKRRVCSDCLVRRRGRVAGWLKRSNTTMWVEELTDHSGRIAVFAGRFDLERWLLHPDTTDPDRMNYLARTCFLDRPYVHGNLENLPPATARVRRFVETAREFWQSLEDQIVRKVGRRPARPTLVLPSAPPVEFQINLNYDLVQKPHNMRVSAVWDGTKFILTHHPKNQEEVSKGGIGGLYEVNEPTGYGQPDRPIAEVELKAGPAWGEEYSPYLQLQLDPRHFRCVIPATDALDVAALAEELYAERLSRVRSRMGFHLSVIYADADTPLRATLDGARRAQSRLPGMETRTIQETYKVERWDGRQAFLYQSEIKFENDAIWGVPAVYDFATHLVDQNERTLQSQTITSDDYYPYFDSGSGGLHHIRDLGPGMRIKLERSSFDFEFLDCASRRFELAYDGTGARRAGTASEEDRSYRPHPIEYVHKLKRIIELLSAHLEMRQIKTLDGLLAAKRAEWRCSLEELEAFAKNVIANSETIAGKPPFSAAEADSLLNAFRRGLLHDAIEIHCGVHKGPDE